MKVNADNILKKWGRVRSQCAGRSPLPSGDNHVDVRVSEHINMIPESSNGILSIIGGNQEDPQTVWSSAPEKKSQISQKGGCPPCGSERVN